MKITSVHCLGCGESEFTPTQFKDGKLLSMKCNGCGMSCKATNLTAGSGDIAETEFDMLLGNSIDVRLNTPKDSGSKAKALKDYVTVSVKMLPEQKLMWDEARKIVKEINGSKPSNSKLMELILADFMSGNIERVGEMKHELDGLVPEWELAVSALETMINHGGELENIIYARNLGDRIDFAKEIRNTIEATHEVSEKQLYFIKELKDSLT